MNKLTIVIVNYKVPDFLSQCLTSVRNATKGIDCEIVVVDNASNDGSLPNLMAKFPEVIFIENRDNVGFSRANNQAIKATNSQYVLLLNPDTVIGESSLAICMREMEKHPECGAIGVRMLDATGAFLRESKRGSLSPFACACKFIGLTDLFPRSHIFNHFYLGYLSEDEDHEVNYLAGAFMFIRREALEKAGFLDERYFMYGEDLDLCKSIRNSGFTCRYLPIPILHYKSESESADANPERYSEAFYGAMRLFYEKYHPRKRFLNKLIYQVISTKQRKSKKTKTKKKKITPVEIAYTIDLETTTYLPKEIPAGSHVIVSPREGLYDRMLMLLLSSQGRGITLLTHYPEEMLTLGPGGRFSI